MTKRDSTQEFFGIDPIGKSPIQIELEWFHNHYRGDIPQLTVRAVLIGVVFIQVISFSIHLWMGVTSVFMSFLLAFVVPFYNTLSIFAGAPAAWNLAREAGEVAQKYTIPIASCVIAAESLMGVVVAVLGASGIMK